MINSFRSFVGVFSLVLLVSLTLCSSETVSAQQLAYVTSNTGAVSVINTTDKSVLDPIDLQFSSRGIAVHPNGRFLYVVYSGFVDVLETTGYTRVALVQAGFGSRGIAVSADGLFAYVTNIDGKTVSVLDTQTNTVVATVPVLTSPTGVAVTPDGKFVYVSNSDTRTVSVIETAGNTVATQVDVGVSPAALAVSPDGSLVYVPNESDGNVSVIRTSDNTVIRGFGLGGDPTAVAFSADGEQVYGVSAIDSNLTIFDVGPDTVLARINLGAANHRSIAVVSDQAPIGNGKSGQYAASTKYVYVPNLSANSVSIVEFGADTTVTLVDVAAGPWSIAIGLRVDVTANEPSTLPETRLRLESGFPNPFSEQTQIEYTVSEPGRSRLQIFDVTGRLIRNVELGWSTNGTNRTHWDGRNEEGALAPPGLYLMRLQVGERVKIGTLTKITR